MSRIIRQSDFIFNLLPQCITTSDKYKNLNMQGLVWPPIFFFLKKKLLISFEVMAYFWSLLFGIGVSLMEASLLKCIVSLFLVGHCCWLYSRSTS